MYILNLNLKLVDSFLIWAISNHKKWLSPIKIIDVEQTSFISISKSKIAV